MGKDAHPESLLDEVGEPVSSAVMSPPQCPSWSAVHEGIHAV